MEENKKKKIAIDERLVIGGAVIVSAYVGFLLGRTVQDATWRFRLDNYGIGLEERAAIYLGLSTKAE